MIVFDCVNWSIFNSEEDDYDDEIWARFQFNEREYSNTFQFAQSTNYLIWVSGVSIVTFYGYLGYALVGSV